MDVFVPFSLTPTFNNHHFRTALWRIVKLLFECDYALDNVEVEQVEFTHTVTSAQTLMQRLWCAC
eukprot:m.129317 g.129317  ORF g.129317 m.129317 type:complete len:65 (+) comp13043_c0_seq14:3-197(+)